MFNTMKNLPCKIYGTHCIIKKDRNIGGVRTQEWSFLQNGILYYVIQTPLTVSPPFHQNDIFMLIKDLWNISNPPPCHAHSNHYNNTQIGNFLGCENHQRNHHVQDPRPPNSFSRVEDFCA